MRRILIAYDGSVAADGVLASVMATHEPGDIVDLLAVHPPSDADEPGEDPDIVAARGLAALDAHGVMAAVLTGGPGGRCLLREGADRYDVVLGRAPARTAGAAADLVVGARSPDHAGAVGWGRDRAQMRPRPYRHAAAHGGR